MREKSQESTKKLLELKSNYRKFSGYKVNVQKSIVTYALDIQTYYTKERERQEERDN